MIKKRVLASLTLAAVMFFSIGTNVSAMGQEDNGINFLNFKAEKFLDKGSAEGKVDFFMAVNVLRENVEEFKAVPKGSLKETEIEKDEMGYTHVRMEQTFNGVPIFGKEYIVHFDENGNPYAANGRVELNVATKLEERFLHAKADSISKGEALEIAKKEVQSGELQAPPEMKLYYIEKDGVYHKVYDVRVNFLDPEPGDWHVFISVEDGTVLDKYNGIAFGNTDATGAGILGDQKNFTADYSGGEYKLTESKASGTKVITYDAGNKTYFAQYFLPGDVVTSNDATFDDTRHPAAVDAHTYASNVYDYYKDTFNRNSIDGNGMDIKSSVHYKVNYVNAFWNGYQMVYGDGDGQQALALSGALDVVAHEMTHGVTSNEANLTYKNQSGALNESFSDVFGTFVEFKYQPEKADWLCGEDIWTPGVAGDALRSLKDPTLYNQPDHMDNYYNTSADNGGVHTNSGIPNKAAYLITTDIGIEKAEKIYYRALTVYLTSSSNFSDCRAALLQSCNDFYGQGSEYTSIQNAFNAVGVN